MSKNNKKDLKSNGLTYVLLGIVGVLVIFIGYLGINILITSHELGKIDKGIDNLNKNGVTEVEQETNELKSSNSLNTKQIEYSNKSEQSISGLGIDLKVNENKKSASLTIDWKKFGERIKNDVKEGIPTTTNNYEVKGFTKDIKSVLLGKTNSKDVSVVAIFLMEDRTVQYIKIIKNNIINKKAENDTEYFQVDGTIAKVTDVYELYNVDATENNNTYKTIVGVKKDGKYYDLGNAIENNK